MPFYFVTLFAALTSAVGGGVDDPTGAMTVSPAARSTGSHGWRAAWWARIIESSAARLWKRSSNGDIPGLGFRLRGSSAHR